MKDSSLSALLLMLLGLFSASATASSQAEFWRWFSGNEARLFAFEDDQAKVFAELAAQLQRVDSNLTFEFGPVQAGRREFVISASGIHSSFPAVEALFDAAPSLPRWQWVKFRPRRMPLSDLQFSDVQVKADDVRYALFEDREKIGVVLFFNDYSVNKRDVYGQIGYLFLDEALGEYAVETQVGFIDFQSPDSAYFPQSRPLRELPAHFDQQLSSRSE